MSKYVAGRRGIAEKKRCGNGVPIPNIKED